MDKIDLSIRRSILSNFIMTTSKYRYEIHCYTELGELYSEESGWYDDLQKCTNHCIARVNGNTFKEELDYSDCVNGCYIEIMIVLNKPGNSYYATRFTSYKVVKNISSTINAGDNDHYRFEVY